MRDKVSCLKYFVVASGLTFGLYFSLLMYSVFLAAWFSGTNKAIIDINGRGEALFEFFFIPFSIFMMVFGYWFIYREFKKKTG